MIHIHQADRSDSLPDELTEETIKYLKERHDSASATTANGTRH